MTDPSCREPLDGALRAATIIGHWKLVIGHLIRMIHASLRELSGLGSGPRPWGGLQEILDPRRHRDRVAAGDLLEEIRVDGPPVDGLPFLRIGNGPAGPFPPGAGG